MSLFVQNFWSSLVTSTSLSMCLYSTSLQEVLRKMSHKLFVPWPKTVFSCIDMSTHTCRTHRVGTVSLFFISGNQDYLDSGRPWYACHLPHDKVSASPAPVVSVKNEPTDSHKVHRCGTRTCARPRPCFGSHGHQGCLLTIINMTANKNKSPF